MENEEFYTDAELIDDLHEEHNESIDGLVDAIKNAIDFCGSPLDAAKEFCDDTGFAFNISRYEKCLKEANKEIAAEMEGFEK